MSLIRGIFRCTEARKDDGPPFIVQVTPVKKDGKYHIQASRISKRHGFNRNLFLYIVVETPEEASQAAGMMHALLSNPKSEVSSH